MSQRNRRIFSLWILGLLWFLVHCLLVVLYGYRKLYDANGYLQGADFILANGKLEDVHHTFYTTHIGVIMFFRWLFPNLIYPTIIFQCVISGIGVLLLYKASVRIFNSHFAGFLSGIIFLCWWDNIQLNTTLMTESLACSLMCFLIYVLSRFEGNKKDFIWIFILLTLSLFARPTGVIPIVGVVFFLLAYYWKTFSKVWGLNLLLVASILVLGVFAADRMFLRWDFTDEYVQGNIATYMHVIEGTPLYEPSLRLDPSGLVLPPNDARPLVKMVTFMYDNPIHFLKAGVLKLWYLLIGIRPYYTPLHNVFTIVWVSIIYVFFFFGWKHISNNAVKVFVLTIILVNCLLIFISSVDWNNRFYVPMEPVIVLVAGRGAVYVLEASIKFLPLKMLPKWMLGSSAEIAKD